MPWQIYIFANFPAEAHYEASFNRKHLTEVIEDHSGTVFYFLNKIRINYGELIYLPMIWFLWKVANNIRDYKRLAIGIWIFIPLLFFSVVKTKMQAYVLFICPALFLITAEFYFVLNDYKKTHKFKWLFDVILFLFIALPVRYMIERVKPFSQINRQPDWVVDLKKMNSNKIDKEILFNYCKPAEAMFYTNLTAYEIIPDKSKINQLIAEGYTIIINDDGNIPNEIRAIKGVKFKKLSCQQD